MALGAITRQHTKVCCATCGAYGLWGYVVTLSWEWLPLEPVHVCPSCLSKWQHRARKLAKLGCKSWDLVNGRGSKKSPDLRAGYTSLEMTPYVGASLRQTLWDLDGREVDRIVTRGLVVMWLANRGDIKLKRTPTTAPECRALGGGYVD